jgi:hypothetical protein
MNPVGQIPAVGGNADAALNGGVGNAAGGANGGTSQAQFEQAVMQAGAAVGGMLIFPMIMKLIKPPGEGD